MISVRRSDRKPPNSVAEILHLLPDPSLAVTSYLEGPVVMTSCQRSMCTRRWAQDPSLLFAVQLLQSMNILSSIVSALPQAVQKGLSMARSPVTGAPSHNAVPNALENGDPATMPRQMSGPGPCQATAAAQVGTPTPCLPSLLSVTVMRSRVT